MDRRPYMKLPLEPPQEPLTLKFTSLYGSNGAEKDKKILKHLIDHCSHCPSYHDDNLKMAYSECSDPLCHYIYWHYRHYWSKHMLNRQTMEECSACESCTKLYQWMLSHASECLHVSRGSNCCLSLCHEMKKSQHLTNLGKTDHEFIRQVENLPRPLTSYSTPTSHGYGVTAPSTRRYSSQPSSASMHSLTSGIKSSFGDHVRGNYTAICDDQRMPGPPAVGTHQSALRSRSSMNLRHPEKSLQHQHHNHSQSSHDLQRPCRCTSGYESHHPAEYLTISAHNSVVSPPNGSIHQPWVTHDSRSHNSVTTHHPHLALVTGPQSCATTPSGLHQLTTPTEDPLKMSRQMSSSSSGYGTGSSTGRQSITSIFSRDQGYTESIVDEPENSLQVSSIPQRKISAPSTSGFRERKKIRQQQSQLLTNLEDKIPEYISPRGDHGPCILGEEVRPVVIPEDTSYQLPSLQRQDTDNESGMVSGGLEASIDKSHFQDIMSKRKPVKQKAFEHTNESSPSPPVTKRPLQREQSDVSRSKLVMCREGRQSGSSRITKDHYDSIFKFQEQHGILSDQSTRNKVINKQQKQAAAMEHHLRHGTMSDVQSDFDTESSTSDIPGSSPLTSGDFSELDQELTDQDDDKKITSEVETQRTQIKECAMTVEEQVQLINRLKANKMPMSLSMAKVPQGSTTKTMSSKQSQGLSLPPQMSSSTYTPSPNPLLSLTPGTAKSYGTSSERLSNSTLRDEDNFSSSKYSNEPVTLSSTDGSTLTGGSFEGKFTSMRLSSEMSSCRNEGFTKTVNSPNERIASIAHAPQLSDHFQDPSVLASSQMDQSKRSSNYQYDKMPSEEDSRLRSMECDVNTSPSPSPPPCLPGKYKLPSSEVQKLCKAVDDVKGRYHDDLLRIKRVLAEEERIPVMKPFDLPTFNLPSSENYIQSSGCYARLNDERALQESHVERTKGVVHTEGVVHSDHLRHYCLKYQSSDFKVAKCDGLVPFLHHHVLKCDSSEQSYTIDGHDITLRIPEGAIDDGTVFHIEIGVTMYGPFAFPKDTQPVSPIVWVCPMEDDVELKKPFQLTVPHFLTQLSQERLSSSCYDIGFAKAAHSKHNPYSRMHYQFEDCVTKPLLTSYGHRSYGTLLSQHFCFYCLKANRSAKLAVDAGYSLVRIETPLTLQRSEVDFCAIFLLDTCLRSLEEQFPFAEGHAISRCYDFKFEECDTTPYLKIVVPAEHQHCDLAMDPVAAKIWASDVNFWNKGFDAMRIRHNLKMYPPRVKMTVSAKCYDFSFKLPVKFIGCSSDSELDVELMFPLGSSSLKSPPFGVSHRTNPKSHRIRYGKPELSDAFRELLPLSTRWKNIGALLNLCSGTLNKVEADQPDVTNRLQAMLEEWLNKGGNPPPTWAELIDAVKPFDQSKADEIQSCLKDLPLQ